MSETTTSPTQRFIPSGSLGLKMLLVCLLVLLMGVPLLLVEALVSERYGRALEVTNEIGARAGGAQVVGGPILIVPYTRTQNVVDGQGVTRPSTTRSYYAVFAESGTADATLSLSERRRGIYRAATYDAATDFTARFRPQAALAGVDPSYQFDWAGARIVMFVRDSRAIRDTAEVSFVGGPADGTTVTLEPSSDLAVSTAGSTGSEQYQRTYIEPANLQPFAALAPFEAAPEEFEVRSRLVVGGAQRFALAAFAQNTTASIRGDRRDASIQGYFQSTETAIAGREDEDAGRLQAPPNGFAATWSVPFVARAVEKAADLATFNLGVAAERDMAVSFVATDDVYQGVQRAVRYAIMFIGIVFLSTLIFEALSGKKAHPAQYILVGLAQSVFYLLLLAITEIIGFTSAFGIAASATVLLLSYYAGASANSWGVGISAFIGLSLLYGVMFVLMTIEDFAFFAGSVVAFLVIAAAMITTRRINWYRRIAAQADAANAPMPA